MSIKKVAVVTGGARGIGEGVARRLNADGFRLVLWDIDPSAFDAAVAGFEPVASVKVDVSDEASVQAAFAETIGKAGRIDVLVNNAGVQVKARPIWEYDLATWQRIIDINLTGVFLCTRAVALHMKERGSGRIVNIASVSAKHGGANIVAYGASKAGVVALTKATGNELAPYGVLVNAITPTMVETDLQRSTGEEFIERTRRNIPLGRLGRIEEVAALVSWLASEEASFSTAAVFDISGGASRY